MLSTRSGLLLVLPLLLLFSALAPAKAQSAAAPSALRPPAPSPPAPPRDLLASTVFAPYPPSLCGVGSGVLLTIDDFPYGKPSLVESVAALAQRQGVMMEGFPIAKYVRTYQQSTGIDLVARARALHMYMSNHTYDHRQLTTLSDAMVSYEIRYGVRSTYLRPPYGSYDLRVKSIAESLGYRICTWNIDTRDWEKIDGVYPSINTIRNRIFRQLHDFGLQPGSAIVILGHYYTNYPSALRYIPGDLIARGYTLCPLPAKSTTSTVPYPICSGR
jgi:peptidoglycan/xylan/chitin deacetylase (PgdA/CDA1 family)